ncbi:hypothetical protein [Streptomyces sp. NPDC093109]
MHPTPAPAQQPPRIEQQLSSRTQRVDSSAIDSARPDTGRAA